MIIIDSLKQRNSNVAVNSTPFAENYNILSEIGRGKFAVVKRCLHKNSGQEHAAKFLRKRRMGKDCIPEISHEIRMLELSLSHPRIVDIVEVFDVGHDIVIITEYARGGELFQHVMMEEQIEENLSIRLMRQVLEGLEFLHQNNIVHMDIKPQNILLTEPLPAGNIKLCDLGLARYFNCGDDIQEIIGTPDYVAPEVLDYNKLNSACDMWSVGVLAYVILTGCSPFAGDTKQETFLNISQVNLDFPDDLFSVISEDAIDFIRKLLLRDPEDRMTAETALTHSWFSIKSGSRRCSVSSLTFGSPAGQRRTITSTSFGDCSCDEPSKRCKCDESPKSVTDAKPSATSYSSDKENRLSSPGSTQGTTENDASVNCDRVFEDNRDASAGCGGTSKDIPAASASGDKISEEHPVNQTTSKTLPVPDVPPTDLEPVLRLKECDSHGDVTVVVHRRRDSDTCSVLTSRCRLSDVPDMQCSSLLFVGQTTAE